MVSLKNLFSRKNIGLTLFYLGVFLLPSAFVISVFFLFFSLIFSINQIPNYKRHFIEDKLNLVFLIIIPILILISSLNYQNQDSIKNLIGKSYLNYIDLFNWIPLFFVYIGFQKYLSTNSLRERFSKILIAGSLPVLFSSICQIFFNWQTKMETFFGLIIWYQKNIDGYTSITGLFSNQNYLGAWLVLIWPFSISLIILNKNFKYKKLISLLISALIFFLTMLTTSRAAWIFLFLTIPLIFGRKIKKLVTALLLFVISLGTAIYSLNIAADSNFYLIKISFEEIRSELANINLSPRIEIWEIATKLFLKNPLFGSGTSSFPSYFSEKTGYWIGHAHNLPLELLINYGLIGGLSILLPVVFIVFKSFKLTFIGTNKKISKNIIQKVWVTSTSILFFMHLVDIQYFDGRISILGWLLLAGSKKIIEGEEEDINVNLTNFNNSNVKI